VVGALAISAAPGDEEGVLVVATVVESVEAGVASVTGATFEPQAATKSTATPHSNHLCTIPEKSIIKHHPIFTGETH
jgi:hypothetical protein